MKVIYKQVLLGHHKLESEFSVFRWKFGSFLCMIFNILYMTVSAVVALEAAENAMPLE